jgi:chromosome segregation ATPase
VSVVKKEAQEHAKSLDATTDKLIDGQNAIIDGHNAIVDAVNGVKEKVHDHMDTVMDSSKKTQERADRIERSERETRGKLGAQERKRRKEDLDTMARLRNELGVMKRQMRDKDAMVETLSTRVGSLVDHIEDMRRESSERHDALTALIAARRV